jgi:general secretion pathway protein I
MTGRQRGFTLVEILVAMVVLAVAAVSLLQSFAGGLRATDSARQRTYAMLLAQSKLAVVGIELALEAGASEGRFDDRFAWRVVISPAGDGAPAEDAGAIATAVEVMNVTVTVSWPALDPSGSVQLTSARLGRREPDAAIR